jgi:hypothetical protein
MPGFSDYLFLSDFGTLNALIISFRTLNSLKRFPEGKLHEAENPEKPFTQDIKSILDGGVVAQDVIS